MDFTSSSSLASHSFIKHAVAKAVVVEAIVAVKATVPWTHTTRRKLKPDMQWTQHELASFMQITITTQTVGLSTRTTGDTKTRQHTLVQ